MTAHIVYEPESDIGGIAVLSAEDEATSAIRTIRKSIRQLRKAMRLYKRMVGQGIYPLERKIKNQI